MEKACSLCPELHDAWRMQNRKRNTQTVLSEEKIESQSICHDCAVKKTIRDGLFFIGIRDF